MEHRFRIAILIIASSLLTKLSYAQSADAALNASTLFLTNKAFKALRTGDTLKLTRITDRTATGGDLLFEKGTIRRYKQDGTSTQIIGTWSAPKNDVLIFKTSDTFYLKSIKTTSGNVSLVVLKGISTN